MRKKRSCYGARNPGHKGRLGSNTAIPAGAQDTGAQSTPKGLTRKKISYQKEIQLLAGKLHYTAKVVRPGRCFVWHIYNLTSVKGGQNKRVRLNQQIRSDIQWWLTFVDTWNGHHPGHPSMV